MYAFGDIATRWEYSQFINFAKTNKPYRNTEETNPKYPLGNRRYSDRFFKPRIDLIPEDRKGPLGVRENLVTFDKNGVATSRDMPWTYFSPPIEIYYTDRYMLGTFHPDDTFEFNPSWGSYGQGDTGVMSSVLPGWIAARANYGGLVFVHRQTKVMLPVYKGMRIRLCDGAPTEPFELHVNTLDRKKTKPHRTQYDQMFKIATAMLSAMGVEKTCDELEEMGKGTVAPTFNYVHENLSEAFDPNDPAGAVLWLALRYNINDCRHGLKYNRGSYWFLKSLEPKPLIHNVKSHFYSEIYNDVIQKGGDILKSKIYRYGDKLPTTEWGQKILVNGVEHKRIV